MIPGILGAVRILVVLLAWLVLPSWALAKPTVAIAPFDGDRANKVGNVVATALSADARVIRPRDVRKAMSKLGLSGQLDLKQLKKLRGQLEADVVIQGALDQDGKKQRLELSVSIQGKKPTRLVLRFKTSEDLSDEAQAKLGKRIADAEDVAEDKPSFRKDDDDRSKPTKQKPTKQKPTKQKPTKRVAERDDEADGDEVDDDEATAEQKNKKKKKKKKPRKQRSSRDDGDDDGDGDGDGPGVQLARHPVTQAAVRLHAGAAFGRRSLTYDSTAATPPPPVGTVAGSGRIEGEVYPFSLSTLKGPIAGLGFAGTYDKTVGLSIAVPGGAGEAPIDQAHYAIGARYRIPIGTSSLAFGLSYVRRHYIADRSALPTPMALDAPDVDYTAVAPGLIVRIAATPTIGVFAGAEVLLMLSTGQIQQAESYGPADVVAFEAEGGVEIALAPRYGLRFVAELSQIGFSFTGSPGTMAAARNVTGATDRSLGLAATFTVTY